MGFYVNPPDRSKESFLDSKGIMAPSNRVSWSDVPEGFLPVVLVKNPMFTAAAICYNEGELKAWQDPTDDRPMRTYFVRISELLSVADEKFRSFASQAGWLPDSDSERESVHRSDFRGCRSSM